MEKSEPSTYYRLTHHTADCGIEVWGDNPTSLFENAGYALFDLVADIAVVTPVNEYPVQVSGMDVEDLMVSWLRELLDFWTCRETLICDIHVIELSEQHISARIRGEIYHPQIHSLRHDIKAVTYHQIRVIQTPEGKWRTSVVFDI